MLDDKTDLNLGYHLLSRRTITTTTVPPPGLPLGSGAEEHIVTATLTRRITPNLRVNVKYAFSHYNEWASGGNNNYDAQIVYSSLQYRF